MDYLLGRNPLAFSYVSGYGTHALRNPHHRVWAHQKDPKLPEAPPGAVSGGPNSTLQDPYIRKLGMSGCPPETCYVDNVESYSTNEVAINWNAHPGLDGRVPRRHRPREVGERGGPRLINPARGGGFDTLPQQGHDWAHPASPLRRPGGPDPGR